MHTLNKTLTRAGVLVACLAKGAFPFLALAVDLDYNDTGKLTDIKNVAGKIDYIAGIIFGILISLSIVLVLYAAFLYVTDGGSGERVKQAHQVLTYAVVGIIVALLAKGLPAFVNSFLNPNSGYLYT